MKSLVAFENNIKSTDLFTARIHAMSTYLNYKNVKSASHAKKLNPGTIKFVTFDEAHFEKIFEIGFISLFANFEYFMYEFLKELFKIYPKAIPTDKTIKAEDILQFKNYKSVIDFLIDKVAIENSFDLEIWNNTVQKLFNIKPINDDTKIRLMIMNSMRNMYLHAGGKWNSKIYQDKKRIDNAIGRQATTSDAKNGKKEFRTYKSALSSNVAYTTTITCFHDIIKDLKSQIENKMNRKQNVDNSHEHNA